MEKMRIPSLLMAGWIKLLLPTESFANQFQNRCDKAWGKSEAARMCRDVSVQCAYIHKNPQLICRVSAFCKAGGAWIALFPDKWQGRVWELSALDFCGDRWGNNRGFVVNPPQPCW